MDMDELLDRKITELLEQIENLEAGSEERARAVKDVSELIRVRTEKYKVEMDATLRDDQLKLEEKKVERESARNVDQDENQKKFKWLDAGIRIGEFVLTMTTYGLLFRKGLKFEETGTWRSPFFRNLWSRFKPTKMN